MEIELKYSIPDPSVIDELWNSDVFLQFGEIDIDSQIQMHAVYYDTPDGALRGERAAFRIRRENDQSVATLKWNDHQSSGLFEREELNIKLTGERCKKPDLRLFSESSEGKRLLQLVGEEPLVEILRTEYLRRIKRVDTGTVIFEADLDVGSIVTAKGTVAICELELEHFSGSLEEMKKIGSTLAKRFGLQEGVDSKFSRGLKLLDGGGEPDETGH